VNPYNVYLRAILIQFYFAKGNFGRIVELGTDAILSLKLDEEDPKLQEIWNYTSMAYNYMGNSTEAFKWIQKSIDVNPAIGYPYSSLAEIHGMLGQVDLFYHWLEKAFIHGFLPRNIDPTLEPYKSIAKEKKYKDLIQKYSQ
jgi:tetratricopeptide (TPR) repeat protein